MMCRFGSFVKGFLAKQQNESTDTPKIKDAQYWNDKWPTNEVTYKARGRYPMDVRNLILNKSYVLDTVADLFKSLKSYDKQAIALLRFVISHMTYISDDKLYERPEFWQHPEITLAMGRGDCEDGALLLASLLRVIGIPAYRVKLCAGWVKSDQIFEGHAYVIYLADDNEWYTLDWCYWPDSSTFSFLKKPHNTNTDYKEIWWTVNDEMSWAQTSTEV